MKIVQLNPSIPVNVIDKGSGQAIGWIDYGPEHHLLWIVAIDSTGEVWTTPNPKIRMQNNYSLNRQIK